MRITKDRSQVVLVGVSIILLASNIFLIVQNTELKNAVEQSRLLITEEGYSFSDLNIKGLDGSDETINLADGELKTLLFIFSPACNYCVQQYPSWKELYGNLDRNRWRVLAITSDDNYDKIKDHLKEYALNNIKVGIASNTEMRKARMIFTPMTLVVNTDGKVQKVWPGLWKKGFDLPN